MFARTVLRSVRIAGRRTAARNIHASAPLRANTQNVPKASSSDLPWMIGSVAFTVPAAYYLLSSAPPNNEAIHHANQQKKDAVAVEQSSNFNTGAVERADEAVHKAKDSTSRSSTDLKETASSAASAAKDAATSAASNPKETAAAAKDAASDAYDTAKDKASDLVSDENKTEAAKKAVSDAADAAKDKASGAVDAAKEKVSENSEARASNRNPAIRDPGDATQKPVKTDPTSGRMSSKQEGLSNEDMFNPLLQTERGQAISKKGEGVHDSAKIKGTVNVDSKAAPPPHNVVDPDSHPEKKDE